MNYRQIHFTNSTPTLKQAPNANNAIRQHRLVLPMAAADGTSAEAEEEAMWQLPYYYGDLDRDETEQLLTRDGDFLVRKGKEVPGQALLFVLSVIVFGNVRHVILRRRKRLIAVDFSRERDFATISNFVDFHLERNDSISRRELVMLKRAIGRPGVQENYEL
uniref:SH2 domain-containing protein n=1 Tax=Globodera pallida TaxID=36090 RepID=A0A183BNS7_GLOPA